MNDRASLDRNLRWVLVVWAVLLLAMNVRAFRTPMKGNVFPVYRLAGQCWAEGTTCYLDRPPPLDGYRYAPVISMFFVPWTWAPLSVGSVLWRCLNAALLFGGFVYYVRVLMKKQPPGAREWALLLVALIPLSMGSLNNGQVNAFITGLLMIAVAACREERWNLAATCLVLAVWLKIYPLAIGLLLIVAYPRALLPRVVLGLSVGLVLPFLTQHPDYVRSEYANWYHFLKADDRRSNPLWLSYLDAHLLFRVAGIHLSHGVYSVLQLGAAALLALFVYQRRSGSPSDLLQVIFQLGCSWMMLFGPSTEGSTYVMLAPTFAFAVLEGARKRTSPWQRVAVVAAGALFVLRFLWMGLPGGRYYTFALWPLGALVLALERCGRAFAPQDAPRPPERQVSSVRVIVAPQRQKQSAA
jgi:hypothetical protein